MFNLIFCDKLCAITKCQVLRVYIGCLFPEELLLQFGGREYSHILVYNISNESVIVHVRTNFLLQCFGPVLSELLLHSRKILFSLRRLLYLLLFLNNLLG